MRWFKRTMFRKVVTGRPRNLGKSLAWSIFWSELLRRRWAL